jgi:hypothetical protein
MRPDSKSPYRLLVEGADDKWTIINLLERHGFDWNDESQKPWVEDTQGVESLLAAVPTALKTFVRLGVVLDADVDPAGRWQALRDKARSCGVDLPPAPRVGGVIVPGHRPSARFGAWLMPDNEAPGALEELVARLVPAGDPCWPHAGAATTEARVRGAPLAEKDTMKGAIHTWLAWQKIPGQPLGTAIHAQTFRHDSTDAVRFVEWFRDMFVR